MIGNFFKKIIGTKNEREIKRLEDVIVQTNALEPAISSLSDNALRQKTDEFHSALSNGKTIEDIIPEVFAVVREASKRVLGMRHFDVQLIGGMVLHEGKIAEMKTGEGKTLVATLPVYLNALLGYGSHVITVNDYLARRDAGWMGQIYHALGLSTAAIIHDKSLIFNPKAPDHLTEVSRAQAYAADITYGTNSEFGFDYLRDNMAPAAEYLAQKELHFAVIDEVDSILIDEARTPLIISAPAEESASLYQQFAHLVPRLEKEKDFTVDEKMRTISLTSAGIKRMEEILGVDNVYSAENQQLAYHLEEALRAQILFQRDQHYIVKEGEVIIVDEFTGRLMPGRRYSEGLHQAIEAKEGVEVQRESDTLATISIQNFFRLYRKMSGITGTASTEAEEFQKIYGMDVMVVPTNRELVRKDISDRVYKTEAGKYQAIVSDIKERNAKGQPILLGTISVEKNEYLSQLLKKNGVKHEILNAKNHEREAHIIANAGRLGAVTLATNMAGRGTDIILGGAKPEEIQEKLPEVRLTLWPVSRHEQRKEELQRLLKTLGFQEVINFSFASKKNIENMSGDTQQHISVENPMNAEQAFLRSELLSSLLKNLKENQHRTQEGLQFFEIAHVYSQTEENFSEHMRLVGVSNEKYLDFYQLKGIVSALLLHMGVSQCQFQMTNNHFTEPGTCAQITWGHQIIGSLGKLHQRIQQTFGIENAPWYFDLDAEKIIDKVPEVMKAQEIEKFPAVLHDLAIIVDVTLSWDVIEALIQKETGSLLASVELFDMYQGSQIPAGKKSLAFHLVYQSNERTLTQKEVTPVHERLINALQQHFHAQVRSLSPTSNFVEKT